VPKTIADKATDQRIHLQKAIDYAQAQAKKTQLTAGMKTICAMAYLHKGELKWIEYDNKLETGDKNDIAENRQKAEIGKKDTICAEEYLLARHKRKEFMYSYAINQHGLIAACASCFKLLKTREIWDLPRKISETKQK
jgi:hypothetical protein